MKHYFSNLLKKPHMKLFAIIISLCFALFITITLSRYIMDIAKDHYLEGKNFYFNSNRLKEQTPLYKINNWSGIGEFPIEITVNSYKNNILASNFDVGYNIYYVCPADVICSSNKTSGVIYKQTHTDNFEITLIPTREFLDGESITIRIEATSTTPYVKTISADFQIIAGKRGVSYEINDEPNRPYLLFSITNAITSYTIIEAFDSYQVGDKIDVSVYRKLQDDKKSKCVSVSISLEFDPSKVVLDTTSEILKGATTETEEINNISYINKVTFLMDAMSSKEIRFYKIDHTEDYTFPYENNDSIISFEAN